MKERTWKIGEPGADEVCLKNVRLMDELRARLIKRCGNPFCGWPVSSLRDENFGCAEYGDICALCYQLYSNLTFANAQLKNTNYFRYHHAEWEKEEKDRKENEKRRRRKLGLDGEEGSGF